VNERGYMRRTRERRARQKETRAHRVYENLKTRTVHGLMQDSQEAHGPYEPRRGKTKTKEAPRPRTRLFISLTISIINHIQSLTTSHVSIIVQVDHSTMTIHVPGDDTRVAIAKTHRDLMRVTSHVPRRGNLTITRRALCLGSGLSAEI
jgi:hypothetical protein